MRRTLFAGVAVLAVLVLMRLRCSSDDLTSQAVQRDVVSPQRGITAQNQRHVRGPQQPVERPELPVPAPVPLRVVSQADRLPEEDTCDLCYDMRMKFVAGWETFLAVSGVSERIAQQILAIMYDAVQTTESLYEQIQPRIHATEAVIAVERRADDAVCELLTPEQCMAWVAHVEVYDWLTRAMIGRAITPYSETESH